MRIFFFFRRGDVNYARDEIYFTGCIRGVFLDARVHFNMRAICHIKEIAKNVSSLFFLSPVTYANFRRTARDERKPQDLSTHALCAKAARKKQQQNCSARTPCKFNASSSPLYIFFFFNRVRSRTDVCCDGRARRGCHTQRADKTRRNADNL